MPNIIIKNNSTPGAVPLTSELSFGELAINYADGKLFYKKADNTVQEIGSGTTTSSASEEYATAMSIVLGF